MSINNIYDLMERVQLSLGGSSSLLGEEEVEFSASQSLNELGFKIPIKNPKKILWSIERGKRHCLDILRIQSAHRFKYKQLSLNHRFNHYDALIKDMDERFEKALNTDPDLMDIPFSGIMGHYISNGFVYDQFGNDVTKQMNYFFNRTR